jgi:hypothetical protein
MASAYYDIYLKGVFDLASTLVIKSEDTAKGINNWLLQIQSGIKDRILAAKYAVDESEPSTWKYYLNMAGKYHVTDVPMTIVSLDTREEIAFTVENLKLHRGTKKEYTYRSRYVKELLARYPDQASLILGILNPVDIQAAISADDHTILYYDPLLVEATEVNFIPQLQKWIDAFFMRWDVIDYRITDSLYVPAQLGVMFSQLPKAILNIRLDNCRKDFAHSYHIKNYLTSFGRLDWSLEFLNHKQKLFFYRNIRWLLNNPGKADTFGVLTKKVLTDRNFPLAEYNIRHNNEGQPEQIYPDIELRRTSINGIESALGKDIKSVPEMLDLEATLARENTVVQEDAAVDIPNVMKNSKASALQTKVLESNVLDKTDAEPFTLTEVLLTHWIYFANTGRYTTVLAINNPNTGETMQVNAKDAFTMYLYVYNKARGITLDRVPEQLEAMRVRRVPLPSYKELRDMTDPVYVPDYFIESALDNQPVIANKYISVASFRDICIDIHQAMLLHRDLSVYQDHYLTVGQLKMMVDRFYMNFPVNPEGGKDYTTWFNERSFQIEQLSLLECDLLANELFAGATGTDLSVNKSLKEIHAAHLKVMGQLSSYSVQLIQQINSGRLLIADWPHLRFGDRYAKSSRQVRIRLFLATIMDMKSKGKRFLYMEIGDALQFEWDAKGKHWLQWKIGVDMTLTKKSSTFHGGVKLGINAQVLPQALLDLADLIPGDDGVGYDYLVYEPVTNIFDSLTSQAYKPLQ